MPIVSHTTEVTVNTNGSKNVVARYYDQDSREYTQTFYAHAEADVEAIVSGRIPDMDEQLANQEFEALVGAE